MFPSMFPSRLKQLRNERKLSQQKLAKLLGVSKSVISQYENGITNPTPGNLFRLANIFNVSIDYFYGDNFKAPKSKYIVNERIPIVAQVSSSADARGQLDIKGFIAVNNLDDEPYKFLVLESENGRQLVHLQSSMEDGDNIIACVDGTDKTIFKCVLKDDVLCLESESEIFKEPENTIRIVGKIIRNVENHFAG